MEEVEVPTLGEKNDKIYLNKNLIDSKFVYHFVKRVIDIFGSLIGLLVLSPLFIIVGYKIKKEDSGGPVFFSQERVGKDGKIFRMYKFRSMCIDAEDKLALLLEHNEVEGAMFKMKDDPRVTKIGKFIRKTSIDELPQLWNVLKGNMSLVGPRPPLVREVNEYSEYDKQRLYVKPGCTGLWQVSGRNHVGFDEMVYLDLIYIDRLSLAKDFQIIFRTFFVIIKPNGAF
ncbi:sugar transferase [Enterococcus casseliflavus]|uniref:sugar transferase n=1 Tax=Enterococcus casseliflavus TaxID=37734 RepID=UPI001919C781|nr:sugar transferase [Enterococcus casseliflavus]MDV7712276.1 sugar transferase [Enterococcus casseliflavus]QQU15535.1 sugar transferase [Enterococcus casseliflavus]